VSFPDKEEFKVQLAWLVPARRSGLSFEHASRRARAGGPYTDDRGIPHAFLVSEVKGTWQKATRVPGMTAKARLRHADNLLPAG
jgi:hypothetical protein